MNIGTSERADLPIAVVVGAGGMGVSTARRLGNHYRVVLADVDEARAADRAASMRDDGYDARGARCDITDADSVSALASDVGALGTLRALVHVAAISPSMGDWRRIMTLNLLGAARVERAFHPLVVPGTAGVFISSLAAHLVRDLEEGVRAVLDDPLSPGALDRLDELVADRSSTLAYSLAKLAVTRMCARRATAWGRRGGRIVSMSPGMIATPMGAVEFSGPGRSSKLELLERSPVPREGTMVETADAVEFLVSDRASFITGTDLLVDGGVAAAINVTQEE